MLTSAGDINAKVRGFEAGADDYLVKPFDPTELDLRIKALLARVRAAMRPTEELPSERRVISIFSLRGGVGSPLWRPIFRYHWRICGTSKLR